MSLSRCFCFPLNMYAHGTTSPFPSTSDCHLLPSTLKVINFCCRSFEGKTNKLWISPVVRDRWWRRPWTQRLQIDRDCCRFHSELEAPLQHAETTLPCKRDAHERYTATPATAKGGGVYSRESAYSKISPLPCLGHAYCWIKGGLFSGGYGIITGPVCMLAL